MQNINETFTDEEMQRLRDVKADRTWREAVLEEFGVDE